MSDEIINNQEETNNESSNSLPSGQTTEVAEPVLNQEPAEVEKTSTPDPEAVAAAQAEKEEKARENAERKAKMDAIFSELKAAKENSQSIEVEVISRIKGGLRVIYKDLQLFLPASHFTIKRTPTEEELQEAIGAKFMVDIHEVQEMEDGRRAVIVSRKALLVNSFWGSVSEGQIVKGKITSVASFGVFVDIGGIEGLIHISRLSQAHVDDPAKLYKKGDEIEAKVIEINKETNKIGLSRKELEPSPWDGAENEFPIGSKVKGIVRRITDFGVYIELKPGIDGLLRTPEISWTKRIKRPADIFSAEQEVEVEVIAINIEKQTISLSYKRTQANPWNEIAEKYPIGTIINGVVSQVMTQGAIISIGDELDGFMPKSKIRSVSKGKKIPFEIGEAIEVKVSDIVVDQESIIFEPAQNDAPAPRREKFGDANIPAKDKASSNVSFMDMLSENAKNTLFGSVK
jgi:small subunit ribosomal protein S1